MIHRGMLLIRFRRLLWRSRRRRGSWRRCRGCCGERSSSGLRSEWILEDWLMRRLTARRIPTVDKQPSQSTKARKVSELHRCVSYVNIYAHHISLRCNDGPSHEIAILDIAKRGVYASKNPKKESTASNEGQLARQIGVFLERQRW